MLSYRFALTWEQAIQKYSTLLYKEKSHITFKDGKSIGLCGNQISVQYFLFTMHNTLTSVESDPDPSMSIINRINNYVIKQNAFHNNKKKVGSYF